MANNQARRWLSRRSDERFEADGHWPPAVDSSFRGIDCKLLAAQYVTHRRLDEESSVAGSDERRKLLRARKAEPLQDEAVQEHGNVFVEIVRSLRRALLSLIV